MPASDGRINVLDFAPAGVTINAGANPSQTTAAIQAAMNAAAGGTLYFPPGRYVLDAEITVVPNVTIAGNGATLAPSPAIVQSTRFRSFFYLGNISSVRLHGLDFDLGVTTLPAYGPSDNLSAYSVAVYASGSTDITIENTSFANLYTNALFFTDCNGTIRVSAADFSSPAQTQVLRCEHVQLLSTAGDFIFDRCTFNNAVPATAGFGVPAMQAVGCTGSVSLANTKLWYCGRDPSAGTQKLEPICFYESCVNVSVVHTIALNCLYGFMRLANTARADVSDFEVTFAPIADPYQQTFSVESTGGYFRAGNGTVTISGGAGMATFSTTQRGALVNGSLLGVGGFLYVLSAFDGATGGTLAGAPDQTGATFYSQVQDTQASCQDIHIHDGSIREDYSSHRKGVQIGAYDYAVPAMGIRVHDINFVNVKAMCLLGGPYQDVRIERLSARGLNGGYIAVTADPAGVPVTATRGVLEANSVCTDLVIKDITQDLQPSGAVPITIDFATTRPYAGTIGTMHIENVNSRMAGSVASVAQWLVYRGIAGQGRLTVRGCDLDNYAYGLDVANVAEVTIEGNKARNITPTNFLLNGGGIGQLTRSGNRLSGTRAVPPGAVSGRAVLVAGTATVATTEVLAGDNIRLSRAVGAGTARGALEVGAIVDRTSFVINARRPTNAVEINDTSTVFWEIVH